MNSMKKERELTAEEKKIALMKKKEHIANLRKKQ